MSKRNPLAAAAENEWSAFARVEQTLLDWSDGDGSVDTAAAAILEYGGDVKWLVDFFVKTDERRAELAAAYRRARARARSAA